VSNTISLMDGKVEGYWRVSQTFDGVEWIVAVEMRSLDDAEHIVKVLKRMMLAEWAKTYTSGRKATAEALASALMREWDGRYFFTEVGNEEDYWVQIFYPPKMWQRNSDGV
jgi:hypothetical protein